MGFAAECGGREFFGRIRGRIRTRGRAARAGIVQAGLVATTAFAAGAAQPSLPAITAPISLEFLGVATVPPESIVDGTPLGGLSGLAWTGDGDRYVAISDDRSERAPARMVRLELALGSDGKLHDDGVVAASIVTLRGRDGRPFPPRTLDPEGIARSRRGFFVSSEGEAKKEIAPFVALFADDGRWLADLPLPRRYLPRRAPDGGEASGVRDNLAFESLTITPDERYLVSAAENGLAQESPAAAPGLASRTRILRWDLARGGPPAEFVYRVEAIDRTPLPGTEFWVNGLVELLALDDTNLLALERQYVPGIGTSVRLYAVSLAGATDVAAIEGPAFDALPAVGKSLLVDFDALGIRLDNFEALALGPALPDGRRSLFVVSDDNFNAADQRTFVLAFAAGFEPLSIAALQGAGHRSPFEGRFVSGIDGVVTAIESTKRAHGFWLESERGDGDPATSEAIHVDWEGADTLRPGERVRVGGRVEERESPRNLSVTTLALVSLERLDGEGRLPAPPRLGRDRVVPAASAGDGLGRFDPATDALDFWESLESMRVEVPAGTVVGPTRSFGEIALLPDGTEVGARSLVGGVLYPASGGFELGRVAVGRRLAGRMPDLAVGDRVARDFVGIVDYGFSNYHVQPLAPFGPDDVVVTKGAVACGEKTSLAAGKRRRDPVTLASLNVENLSIAGGAERMPAFGKVVVDELRSPTFLALEEIQDDSGTADDGVVTSKATVDAFVAAIAAAGGPAYRSTWIDPENGRDGGQPGGNIRVVLLHDPARARLVERGHAGPSDATAVAGSGNKTALTLSPGRVAPKSAAFDLHGGEGVRKSLAAEFDVGGRTLFVVANHLSSKWDDDRLFGARQPPLTPTGAKRLAQTRELRRFAESLLAADPKANLVILGDLNEPEWAAGVSGLGRPPLALQTTRLAPGDRYTFNFEGLSQAIDHVVVSPALAATAEIDIVHRNSDCPESVRVSDHDPVVVRVKLR